MTKPKVSIVIACHNYARYLPDAVHSLIGGSTSLGKWQPQSLDDFEAIIVNDNSTDDTAEIARKLVREDSRVVYIEHIKNRGTPATYNTGVAWATGEFLTMLSADDMRESWSLEMLYEACMVNPHKVIYDDLQYFADGQRGDILRLPGYSFDAEVRRNILHAGIMFPYHAWEDVGGYEESMTNGREEHAFGIALGLKDWFGVHIPRPGYLYRQEGQGRSLRNSTPEWQMRFLRQLKALYPDAFAQLTRRTIRGQITRRDKVYDA